MNTRFSLIYISLLFTIMCSLFGTSANNIQAGETYSDLSFLTNGLSAYYPFNGNAQDASGNNWHGTAYQVQLTEDRFGRTNQAYAFDPTKNSFILIPETVSVAGASNLTVSLWFKTYSLGTIGGSRYLFTRLNWINAEGVPAAPIITDLELYDYNILYLNIDNAASWLPSLTLKQDTWYHAAVSLSGNITNPTNRTSLYINGQPQNTTTSGGPSNISDTYDKSTTAVGALLDKDYYPSGVFDGSIDDVRIYNRTLSAEEIASLYAYESVQRPSVSIAVKSVRVTMLVEQGKTYQLKTSNDLQTWVTNGPPFVATAPQLDQDFDVADGQRYFQLIEVP